jgi:hypothetical protein
VLFLKPIDKSTYDDMKFLGLLKEERVEVSETTEEGKVIKDRYGNPRKKIITTKNYRVTGKGKKASQKTHFVEEPTYQYYLKHKEELKKKKNEK